MAKQKSNQNLLKLLHKVTCYVAASGMLIPTSNVLATTKMDAVNAGLQAVNQIGHQALQQYMTLQQQNMGNRQLAAQMQSLSSPTPTPAKFFNDPNFHYCFTAPAKTAFPDGACEGGISDDMSYQQAEMFRQYSLIHSEFYDQLISEAQNTAYPKGVQCLEDGMKVFDNKMQDKINYLTSLQDELKKQQQLFKEANDKLKKQMADLNRELTGGSTNSIEDQKRNYKNYFSPECQNVIGEESLSSAGRNGGLIGIQQGMSSNVTAATNFSTNKSSIERDLNNTIQELKSDYNKYGASYLQRMGKDLTSKGGYNSQIAGLIVSEAEKLGAAQYNAQQAIDQASAPSGTSYKLPAVDKNYSQNLENFKTNITNQVKKDYINGCVTGAENGVGLTLDQVIRSMRYGGTGRGSGTIKNTEVALQSIMNDTSLTPEQKIAKINSIDNGSVLISYKSTTGQTITTTPYGYFREVTEACETQFNSSTTSGDLSSSKNKLDTMNTYIDDLINLEKTFISDLSNEITEQIINCGGETIETTSCSNPGTFSTSGQDFCVKRADTCAAKVQACYATANQIVEQKTAQLNTLGAQYDQQVTGMVAAMEQKLKQIKDAVVADAKFLQQYFGQSFQLPNDLFVKMPEKGLSEEFGIEVLGSGDTSFIDALPAKIDELKGLLAEQKNNVQNNVIRPYIEEQKSALANNKAKWDGLLSQCKQSINAYHDGMAQSMAQAQAQQAESNAQVSNACNQIKMFGSSPLAFCEGGNTPTSLSESMSDVLSAGMNQEMALINQQFVSLCTQHQNEKELGAEKVKVSGLAQACFEDGDWSDVQDKMKASLASSLPADLQDESEKIMDYVFDGKGKLPTIEDEALKKQLEKMKETLADFEDIEPESIDTITSTACSFKNEDTQTSCQDKIDEVKKLMKGKGYPTGNFPKAKDPCSAIKVVAIQHAAKDVLTDSDIKSRKVKSEFNEMFDENIFKNTSETKAIAKLFDTTLNSSNNLQWQKLGERANNIGCFQGNNVSRGFMGFGQDGMNPMPGMGGFNGLTRQ